MRYLKKLRIRVQLTLLVAMIVVIVFFILIMNYTQAALVLEAKNSEYIAELIAQLNQTIASNSDGLKRILENTAYNRTIVQTYLSEPNPTAKYEIYSRLADYLSDMMSMKDGILDIALFGTDGTKFNLNGDIDHLLPFVDEIPEKRLYYYSGVHHMMISNFNRNVFIVGCPIYSIMDNENMKQIGTLMIVVEASSLLGSPSNINGIEGALLYALDRNEDVFSSNDTSVEPGTPYSDLLDYSKQARYFVQSGSIQDLDGQLVFKLPQSKLLRGIEDIRKRSFLVLAISLVLLTIPFTLVVNNILRPLKSLMSFMNGFKLGKSQNLSNRIHLQGYAEISSMANHFNRMLDEIDELTGSLLEINTKLYKAEILKKQAELAFLHSQINPHFLYNTLESIKGLAVEQGSDRIFQMVTSLAYVFRFSVKAADTITLQEEIKMVQSYLNIQLIRFANRFTVEYQIQEAILPYKVPKMILQPIIENAICHGLEPKTGEGHLLLSVEQSGTDLLLTVSDNGMGMEDVKVREISQYLSSAAEPSGIIHTESIGLVNVNNRIKMYYGYPYGITIRSKPAAGTTVVIRLPIKEVSNV